MNGYEKKTSKLIRINAGVAKTVLLFTFYIGCDSRNKKIKMDSLLPTRTNEEIFISVFTHIIAKVVFTSEIGDWKAQTAQHKRSNFGPHNFSISCWQ